MGTCKQREGSKQGTKKARSTERGDYEMAPGEALEGFCVSPKKSNFILQGMKRDWISCGSEREPSPSTSGGMKG